MGHGVYSQWEFSRSCYPLRACWKEHRARAFRANLPQQNVDVRLQQKWTGNGKHRFCFIFNKYAFHHFIQFFSVVVHKLLPTFSSFFVVFFLNYFLTMFLSRHYCLFPLRIIHMLKIITHFFFVLYLFCWSLKLISFFVCFVFFFLSSIFYLISHLSYSLCVSSNDI